MHSRRFVLASAALAGAAAALPAAGRKMTLALHQTTSQAQGYRKSLEGWSRAGIRYVELTNSVLDEFLKTEDLAAARRVIGDTGVTPVQAAVGVANLFEPNPNRAAALDNLKRRCEQFAALGLKRVYANTGTAHKPAPDDYKAAPAHIHDAGEVARQFNLPLHIEFVRASTFISTLPTLLQLTRAAAHPNVAPLLDCYHFWSGFGKFEDLDLIRPGEIGHVHFQDTPDMPRELLDTATRVIPGDGVCPLARILGKLSEKGYAGPLSVELLLPKFQQGDAYEVAREIRQKSEAVMARAGVL